MIDLCFVLSFFFFCVCERLLQNNMRMYTRKNILGPLRECRSIRSGASGLPYYCAPRACVSDVLELLAVWRHYKPKTKNHSSFVCISAYANVYSKTTIIKQNVKIILIAGVPKRQVAPVYLITAHNLCAFLVYLARYHASVGPCRI